MTPADVVAAYLDHARQRGVRALDVIASAHRHAALLRGLGPAEQEAAHRELARRLSPASVRRVVGVWHAALRWHAARTGAALPPLLSPAATLGPAPDARREPVPPEALRALWEAAQSRESWRRYLWLALGTGARPEALLRLTRAQVAGGLIRLAPPGWRPSRKRRPTLPAPPALADERGLICFYDRRIRLWTVYSRGNDGTCYYPPGPYGLGAMSEERVAHELDEIAPPIWRCRTDR